MTHAQADAETLYLKQVPDDDPNADGVWAPFLLDGHHTVCRSYQPDPGQAVYHTRAELPQA